MRNYLLYFVFFITTNFSFAGGTTYAVIVGVSDYKNFKFGDGDLTTTSRNAQLFYNYLVSKNGGKVPIKQVLLLKNEQATREAILSAIDLFQRATEEDRVIFYFTGHGDKNVFLPYDTNGTDLFLTHKEVKQAFRKSKAGSKICIADACFSGTMKKRAFSAAVQADTASNYIPNESNVVVFMSCLPTQVSYEYYSLKQTVFTYFLLRGFLGEADSNQDKIISAFEIYDYVSKKVVAYSKKYLPDQKPQTPIMYGKFPKELPLFDLN